MIPNKGVLHATNDLYKDLARNLALSVPIFAACGVGAQVVLPLGCMRLGFSLGFKPCLPAPASGVGAQVVHPKP